MAGLTKSASLEQLARGRSGSVTMLSETRKLIQEFTCSVEEKGEDTFFMLMVDMTNENISDEVAEAEYSKIPGSRDLLVGQLFFWRIYDIGAGVCENEFEIPPLVPFTEEEIAAAGKRAAELFELFNQSDSDT